MRACNRCGVVQPVTTGYYRNKRCADGHLTICKTCICKERREYVAKNYDVVRAKVKEYWAKNPEKIKATQAKYKAKHKQRLADLKRQKATGFTPEMFAAVMAHQGGKCPICLCELAELKPQQQHADHCHGSGQPRGILCQTCNTGLGKFKDDPVHLRRAVAYLENPPTLDMLL